MDNDFLSLKEFAKHFSKWLGRDFPSEKSSRRIRHLLNRLVKPVENPVRISIKTINQNIGFLDQYLAGELSLMPSNLGSDLLLAKTRIRRLPDNLKVDGDLNLQQCERLISIGTESLIVKGNLLIGGKTQQGSWWKTEGIESRGVSTLSENLKTFLRNESKEGVCPIRNLPATLKVGGSLVLRGCQSLSSLPDKLSIGGSLMIVGSQIELLPDELEIDGDLVLIGCPISKLPAKLVIGGDLRLIGLPLKTLPVGLAVKGTLTIENCKNLTHLTELSVGNHLRIRGGNIARITASVCVGLLANGRERKSDSAHAGCLSIVQCSVEELNIEADVHQSITIKRCKNLKSFHRRKKVSGDLRILDCRKLKRLPENLHVGGRLTLDGCLAVTALPDQLCVLSRIIPRPERSVFGANWPKQTWLPAVSLLGCQSLKSLPDMSRVMGSIEIAETGIKELTVAEMEDLRLRWRNVNIPARYLFNPNSITADEVFTQRNAEIRRVMIERMGSERLLKIAKGTVVHEDTDPGGKRRLIEFNVQHFGVQTLRFLNCFCPSTNREYMLQVPLSVHDCHAAAAWLAGFDNPDLYKPLLET